MHRRHLRAGLAALALCALSTAAARAADPAFPDMRGTWRVEAKAVVSGAGKHYPTTAGAPAGGAEPRLAEFEATLRVTGQEGARFWGTVTSPAYGEDLVGTFTGEGGRFFVVDSDGFWDGEVLAPGSARHCYRQIDPTLHVASCGTLTKE